MKECIPDKHHPVCVLASEAVEGILFRLEPVRLQPKRILVISGDFGLAASAIRERYPDAEVTVKDYAAALSQAGETLWRYSDMPLSVATQPVDLIVSNLLLPWCPDFSAVLRDWQRLLRPGGLLILSSYGPGTLSELAAQPLSLPHFVDMHHVGDAMMEVGLVDPVMDVDHIEVRYKDSGAIVTDLRASGMLTVTQLEVLPSALSYEIVYGHAWKSQQQRMNEDGLVSISVDALRAQLQK